MVAEEQAHKKTLSVSKGPSVLEVSKTEENRPMVAEQAPKETLSVSKGPSVLEVLNEHVANVGGTARMKEVMESVLDVIERRAGADFERRRRRREEGKNRIRAEIEQLSKELKHVESAVKVAANDALKPLMEQKCTLCTQIDKLNLQLQEYNHQKEVLEHKAWPLPEIRCCEGFAQAMDERAWTPEQVTENMEKASKTKGRTIASDLKKALLLRRKINSGEIAALDLSHRRGVCAARNCNKKAYTDKHISWCRKHEQELVKKSWWHLKCEMKIWPLWLQAWIKDLTTEVSVEECHELLYRFACPLLLTMTHSSRQEESTMLVAELSTMLVDALSTYRKHYNPIPEVAAFLLQCALVFIIIFFVSNGVYEEIDDEEFYEAVPYMDDEDDVVFEEGVAVEVALFPMILGFVANAARDQVLFLVDEIGWRVLSVFGWVAVGGLMGAGAGVGLAAACWAAAEAGAVACVLGPAGFLLGSGAALGVLLLNRRR